MPFSFTLERKPAILRLALGLATGGILAVMHLMLVLLAALRAGAGIGISGSFYRQS